jgi:P pilus assembly chaperone PapD
MVLRSPSARCASADSRVGLFAAAAILLAALAAHAGVNVEPTRLVLEHGSREGEFVVVNPGTTTERYRVTLVNRRMGDDGRIVEAPRALPGDRFADALIHFKPRLLVLRPNEPETVRVRIEPRGVLLWGEYRSHLMLEQIPQPPAAPAPDAPRSGRESAPRAPAYALTVPVIVRAGSLAAEGQLSDLALRVDERGTRLHMRIHRTGQRSLFGDLEVRHEVPGAPSQVVGRASGVALYTPNEVRPFSLAIRFPDGGVPAVGQLRVEYRDAEPAATGLIAAGSFGLTPH